MTTSQIPKTDNGQESRDINISEALRRLKEGNTGLPNFTKTILFIIGLGMGVVGFLFNDPMYGSAMFAIAFSLVVFSFIQCTFPQSIEVIWNRKIITARSRKDGQASVLPTGVESQLKIEDQFVDFLCSAGQQYQSLIQWVLGFGGIAVVLLWHLLYLRKKGSFLLVEPYIEVKYSLLGRVDELDLILLFGNDPNTKVVAMYIDYLIGTLGLLVEVAIAYIIGLIVWRLIVIALHLWDLGGRFELDPQLFHPDRCGGLKPIGNLCLLNALIVTIPGLFLAMWLYLSEIPYVLDRYGKIYGDFHVGLLIILILLAAITFVLPVWRIHKALLEGRNCVQLQIDMIGVKINNIAESLLPRHAEVTSEVVEQMYKQLKSLRELYQELFLVSQQYPKWPFNTNIILQFGLFQIPQILALLGFAEPVRNIINGVVDFIFKI